MSWLATTDGSVRVTRVDGCYLGCMAINSHIVIKIPNNKDTRYALHRLADHAYRQAGSARSHDMREATTVVASAIKIALEPEQLMEPDPPA